MGENVLLEVNNISVDYLAGSGAVHAVRDVSLTLRRGEILGLAGESGSGKSTLAYAIARLLRPPALCTAGEVFYYRGPDSRDEADRIDVLRLSKAELRAFRWSELSIVFQSAMNSLNPVMDIGTQITDVLRAHQPATSSSVHQRRAAELLKLVGIAADRLHSYPHELSGGMRQRAVIAIALALQPELIIMDEPTTALDVVVQREILELISSLCKEFGMALIFITHDLSLLLELANRVAVMYAGKLVELATCEDLYQHPRHPYTYGLMHSFPTLHGPRRRMRGIPGSPPDLRTIPVGCSFHARCPFAFDACREQVPPLRPAIAETQQYVACHLYNSALTSTTVIPGPSQFAQGYEALEERTGAL